MTLTTLELRLISPERTAFQREVSMVILPGADGQFGVLPQHMNLIAEIVPGKVEVREGSASLYFYVSSGVAHISSTQCSVLVLDIVDAADADTSGLYERREQLSKELANSDSESQKADLQADSRLYQYDPARSPSSMTYVSIPIAQYILLIAAIMCRVGAAVAHFPAIGEATIPVMIKVVIALTISICVGLALPAQPYIPGTSVELALLLVAELLLGTAFGITLRITLYAMHTVGLIVATQAGLATAMMLDPSQGSENTPFSTFLTITAVVLLLAFDLHLMLIDGIAQSYSTFPLGAFYAHSQNFAMLVTTALNTAFNAGVKMAVAYIIVGSLVSTATGIASRLIPHIPMFILAIPGQIMVMLWFLMLSVSGLMLWFIDYYQDTYQAMWG